jgi:hypothetical protein
MHAAPSTSAVNPPVSDHSVEAPKPPVATDRDSQGRFTKGNPGGPGNPYYRRQAQLKRVLLACVSDEDVQAVMQTLIGLARGGDLAAIKLFLEYTVGKPAKAVDPDKEELHEWQLQQQTPRLEQVLEVSANGIETPRANQVVRELVPLVSDCQLQTISQQLALPLEGAPPPTDRIGGKRPSASARRMAAGVPPAVPTVDIGDDLAAWNVRLDQEMARAVQTGDIGALMAHFRSRPPGRANPTDEFQTGSD